MSIYIVIVLTAISYKIIKKKGVLKIYYAKAVLYLINVQSDTFYMSFLMTKDMR